MKNTSRITAFLLVSVMLFLCFTGAYRIEASDIFTDSEEELFFDSIIEEYAAGPECGVVLEQCEESPSDAEERSAEIDTASGSEMEIETEAPSGPDASLNLGEETLVSLEYENNDLRAVITEKTPGILTENASLTVIPVKDTEEAYQKLLEALAAHPEEYTNLLPDIRLFDFLVNDADGNVLEPIGEVHAAITYKISDTPPSEISATELRVICPETDTDTGELVLQELDDTEQTSNLEFTENGVFRTVDLELDKLGAIAFLLSAAPYSGEEVSDSEVPAAGAMPEDAEMELVSEDLEFDTPDENVTAGFEGDAAGHESILTEEYLEGTKNEWQIVSGQYGALDAGIQTTEDKLFRYQKNVIPTDVENEFWVYLNVEPRMWRRSEWENDLDIWTIGDNSGTTGEIIYLTDPTNAQQVKKDTNAGQTAKLCHELENPVDFSTSSNKTKYINKIQLKSANGTIVREFPVKLSCALNQNSETAFRILVASSSVAAVPDQGYPYTLFTDVVFMPDEKNGNTGTLTIPSTETTDMPGTYSSMFAKVIPHEIINEVLPSTIGLNEPYIELLEATASSGTIPPVINNSITWTDFSNDIKSSNAEDFYEEVTDDDIYIYRKHAYELIYKVRLKVDVPGFQSCAQDVFAGKSENFLYNVVNTAMTKLNSFSTPTAPPVESVLSPPLVFPPPQVRGLLYNIEYLKVNDAEEPLSNASFSLTGTTGAGKPFSQNAISGNDGFLKFRNLPWGIYTITETTAPPGYELKESALTTDYSPCYTDAPGDFIQEHDSGHLCDLATDISNALPKEETAILTNPRPRVSHVVEKIWAGASEESLDVELKAYIYYGTENQRELSPPDYAPSDLTGEFWKHTLSSDETDADLNWKHTWENLLKYYYFTDEDDTPKAVPITYTVTELLPEVSASKYTSTTEEKTETSEDGITIGTTTITNTSNDIQAVSHTVKKIWSDTTKMEDSLDVELKAYYHPPEKPPADGEPPEQAVSKQVELSSEEYTELLGDTVRVQTIRGNTEPALDWTFTWTNLPPFYSYTDADNTIHQLPLIYTVVEDLGDAASEYTSTTIESADGLTTTIRNSPVYELPSAGGNGIFRYIIGGVVLMLVSVFLLFRDRYREGLKN